MAKLTRVKQEIFGSSGATTEFGVFGSDSEGAAATSKDPALIQSLATFLRGLYGSTANASQPPRIQDMNALYYLFARQIAYGMQAGIPEWLETENYYANGSVVLGSNGKIYISKTGTDKAPNVNNNPVTDTGTNWRFLWSNEEFTATPLSDLSRVFRITGSGIPLFPDNAAGILYTRDKNWTVTTGWTGGTGVTLSIENSSLKVVQPGGNIASTFIASASYQNKLVRVVIKCDTELTSIYTVTGSSVFTPMRFTKIRTNKYVADIYWSRTGSDSLSIIPNYPATTALTWYLETIQIGTGAYDTPVYDKACCNRFTNNGVLPVPGQRGAAMLFQGAQYLVADNPVIGTTGTFYIRFQVGALSPATTKVLADNRNSSFRAGITVIQSTANVISINFADASSNKAITIGTVANTGIYTAVIFFTPSSATPFFNGTQGTTTAITVGSFASVSNLKIGAGPTLAAADYFNGIIHDIGYDTRIWTQADVTRYNNGDDPVDTQQKAQTPVPFSIMIRNSLGQTQAAAGSSPSDVAIIGQVRTILTGNVLKTVGSGGDFATLNAAKAWLETVTPGDNAQVELRLLAGFVMAESWIQQGGDYGWVRITSVSAEVSITRSALSSRAAFIVQKAGMLPRIEALFNMDSSAGSNTSGLRVLDGSRAIVGCGAGIKNVGRAGVDIAGIGIYVGSLGRVIAGGAIFSASAGVGIWMQAGGTLYAETINISGCHTAANIDGSTAYLQSANASGNSVNGVIANNGARVVIECADTKRDATERTSDIQVCNGSIISAVGASGGVSQTKNTITLNGIIFK